MKVKVHIVTDVSDLSGVHKAGDEPEVEEERAAQYLASGLAVDVTGDVAPTGTRDLGLADPTKSGPTAGVGKPKG